MDSEEDFLQELEKNNLEEGDIAELKGELPEKPTFPFLMFTLGLTKDILDCCDGIGAIGAIANVAFFVIFFFYFWKHSIGSSDKKAVKEMGKTLRKKIIKRYAVSGTCEFIFLLNLIPFYSLLVLWAYEKESGMVSSLVSMYDKFEKFKKPTKFKYKISDKNIAELGKIKRFGEK